MPSGLLAALVDVRSRVAYGLANGGAFGLGLAN